MSPNHRSPYLVAYPAVILSAWIWGLAGSVACAGTAGLLIEYFIFSTHQVDLAPTAGNWLFREAIFLLGSVIVGALTRSAASYRQSVILARVKEMFALLEADKAVTAERERVAQLARENEARVHLALDGANVGLWEWDIKTGTSTWSEGFYRLHGIQPETKASYEAWRNAVHPSDRKEVDAELAKALEEGRTFFAEYRICLPGNQMRWVACQGSCVFEDDKVVRMVGYSGDVTRRKLGDLALLEAEKLAVAGRLTASIAHEVNNPLGGAMNLLYLAKASSEESERQRLLDEAMQQLMRVSQIATQTLKFSRTSKRAGVCRASDLVKNTLELLRPRLNLAHITVDIETRQDLEFSCFSGEMQQILTNILINAADAIREQGKIRVRVAGSFFWRTSTPAVRITIVDDGSGMSPDVMRRMREPFFTTKEDTGTGLGMWIVTELIRRHHGRLSVRSKMDPTHHGTAVSMLFPVSFLENESGEAA